MEEIITFSILISSFPGFHLESRGRERKENCEKGIKKWIVSMMTGMMTLPFFLPPQFYDDQLFSLSLFITWCPNLSFSFSLSTHFDSFLLLFHNTAHSKSSSVFIFFISIFSHLVLSWIIDEWKKREKGGRENKNDEKGTGVKNLFYCLFGLFILQHNFTSKLF